MARPFPTTFEKDSQLQNSSGGAPISYQANVNRQKTKKWVDAKAANYGGDDYDSDEYDDYNEPPPPPAKQSTTPPAAATYKKSYGDLPPAPGTRQRANSFDADDEKRDFSSTTAVPHAQQTAGGPPTHFSQIIGAPPPLSVSTHQTGEPSNSAYTQPGRVTSGDPNVIASAPSENRSSTGGYQAHRDYSPTAAPAPLSARATGVPSAAESPSARFPARKSSLSQLSGPNLAEITQSPQETQPEPRVGSPSAPVTKALPFIRPADIYRRAEEERRQSIESGSRPSMDTLTSSKPIDRPESPGLQAARDNSSVEDPRARRRPSIDRDDSPGGRFLNPGLEPVKERKSEYGFEGFDVNEHAPSNSGPSSSFTSHPLSDSAKLDVQDNRRQSASPKLPDLNRISGFGMDMFMPSQPEPQTQNPQLTLSPTSKVPPENPSTSPTTGPGLHGKDGSSVYHSLDDEELAPPRSLAHQPSEQSFRPNLPGGWNSYTTTQAETPPVGSSQISLQPTPESGIDIAPTTTKHLLPQSASEVALADFESGGPRGAHDKDSALPPPPPFSESSSNAMPTPDSSMAPSGNLYSTTNLDPRLLPSISAPPPADAPPPPLAKNSPLLPSIEDTGGYFPSNINQSGAHGGAGGLNQAPVLTRDAESDQDENDRLEEEIVSRLSPQPRETVTDKNLLAAKPGEATRESTYLPAEYGDYWASTEDEPCTPPLDIKQGTAQQSHPQNSQATPNGSLHRNSSQTQVIAPLSVAKSEAPNAEHSEVERPTVKHRFSWEQSSENVTGTGETGSKEVGVPPSTVSEASTPVLPGSTIKVVEQDQLIHEMPSSQSHEPPISQFHDEKIAIGSEQPSSDRGLLDDHQFGRESAVLTGGAAFAAGATVAAAATNSPQDGRPERRLSLAEEKATRVSSYPVNVTPPENEHPARSPEPYFSTGSDQPLPPPPSSSVSPINSPTISQPPPSTSRLLAFKEIMNMKSPHQRIQTFDETRHRFAAMDSGLTNWMEALRTQHPEHATSTGLWPATGLGAGSAKAGGPPSASQSPYYQQYLNASSPTGTSTTSSKPGPSGSTAHLHQGSSPGGPKITTQQVQAKGKEFLHTAGIFGGKAGKAGKGLLAKGKSRFLGGGGDKITPSSSSSSPKPKSETRSSWGLALSKPKSSGPSDKSNRLSRQTTPVAGAEQQRTATMTSISSQPPQLLAPESSTGDIFGSGGLPGTPDTSPSRPPINTQARQQDEPIMLVREIRDADQSTTESEIEVEDRDKVDDNVAPPRPIGKHQPSWDPFNATPIAEEQASAIDMRPNQQSYPFPNTVNSETQPRLVSDIVSQTDRSDHGQVYVHESEDQSNIKNDWVMVGPEEVVRETTPTQENRTSIMHRKRGSSYEIPLLPSSAMTAPSQLPPAPPTIPQSSTDAVKPDLERDRSPIVRAEPEEQSNSTFLPPIRRTSALGFKFGSRKSKQRFPIDDEDEDGSHAVGTDGTHAGVPANASHTGNHDHDIGEPHPIENRSLQQEDSGYATERPGAGQINSQPHMTSGPPRPMIGQGGSFEHNSSNLGQLPTFQTQSTTASRPSHMRAPSSDSSRRSQDAWRPNVVSPPGGSHISQNVPMPVFTPHQSWEHQRPRAASGSSQNMRSDGPGDRQGSMQGKTYEQPPSSAQRYPELFRTGQAVESPKPEPGDLPAHYYQSPITREAAFLPRQQTNEYEIPGIGPPTDEPQGHPRRNSGFFRDIGGKISRATSRERGKSVSRDDEFSPSGRQGVSRPNDDADSSIISEDGRDKAKRRSSFFGVLGRSSTGTSGISNAPHSRESVIAHPPGSRTDLVTPQSASPISPPEKKPTFFGGRNSTPPVLKSSKLNRQSTTSVPEAAPAGKKKRFSALSGLFASRPDSRASASDRSPSTRDLSHDQRHAESGTATKTTSNNQPVRSQTPQGEYNHPSQSQFSQNSPRPQSEEESSQNPRKFLSKMRSSHQPKEQVVSQPPAQSQQQEATPAKVSKARRSSAAGLLGGIMGRKTSHDANNEDAQSQSSQQANYAPPGRTYSGISEQQLQKQPTITPVQPEQQYKNQQAAPEERGRQMIQEPQYDTVPIPGGYSLVRAQAGQTVPTDYDPRGYRSQQQSGVFLPQGNQQANDQMYGEQPNSFQDHRILQQKQPKSLDMQNINQYQAAPHISALENYQTFVSRQSQQRLSREDLLARSPALPAEGQQRPYQLSLPDDNDDREYTINNNRGPVSPPESSSHIPNSLIGSKPQHDSIQRLQGGPQRGGTPQLRHPESPAGYPLPEDVVFSPVNPSAQDLPPPPPPKDTPLVPDHNRNPSNSSYLTTFDLNRSGTHRTAISAISGMSDPPTHSRALSPVHSNENTVSARSEHRDDRAVSNPTPTPPSPAGTPLRIDSPDPVHSIQQQQQHYQPPPQQLQHSQSHSQQGGYTTTVLEAPPRRQSLDLYDASPLGTSQRVNDVGRGHTRQRSGGSKTPSLKIQTQQPSHQSQSHIALQSHQHQQSQHTPPIAPVGSSSESQTYPSNTNTNSTTSQANIDISPEKLAELEGTKADGFNMKITPSTQFRSADQEEKIFYDAESGMRGYGVEAPPSMSATSYPGQEWNPYGGGWEEDDDDVVVSSSSARR